MNDCLAAPKPWLVAIVGASGSGKSWLATALGAQLGNAASHLRLDDFYRDRAHLSSGRRARLNFDHPRAIDWSAFEEVLTQCQPGEPMELPDYDFAQHVRSREPKLWRPKPIVLVEGLWLLRKPALRRRFALSIYIDCSAALQLQRRVERDTRERGRTPAQVRAQFAQTVAPMGQRYVLPQKRWADIVLGSPISAEALETVTDRIRRLAMPRACLEPAAAVAVTMAWNSKGRSSASRRPAVADRVSL